ncbi:MAG: ABC transporter permease subunit [Anaerolineales bacterium]|nr:ABC transporter permease subunit [Anaerolineales bacterium]
MKNRNKFLRSLGLGLSLLAGFVIYAYGFQVTQVDLEETQSPRRQEQLIRILRALARPHIFEYEQETRAAVTYVMIPCPANGYEPPEQDKNGPYAVMTPSCTDPQGEVIIEGFNLYPDTVGGILLVPAQDVELQFGTFTTDADGHFVITATLPKRERAEPFEVHVITRQDVGTPRLTRSALDTWDKIVETVFLALLATTLGTLLSIPLSFFAARNLMKNIKSSLTSISLSLILIPIGLVLGATLARWAGSLSEIFTGNAPLTVAGLFVAPALSIFGARWALPQEETTTPPLQMRMARIVVLVFSALLLIGSLFLLSSLLSRIGDSVAEPMGAFGFIGTFVSDLGEILGMVIVLSTALAGAGVLNGIASQLGLFINERTSQSLNKALNLVLATMAGAVLFGLIGAGVDWLYLVGDPIQTLYWPAGVGGLLGLTMAIWNSPKWSLPIGLAVYYIARTIFNALRSIEALIMVVVFVVWVGIGPFAGVLALSLHTIASLAKLYSEQVESIMAGPLEAIQATGANRLQTIIYAVVPQIVPPYISYTMYRWDINVRMSTIIGFGGGGGIGFLLLQNINLLNYRDASVQMIAIAIVVSIMDYISSVMREKVV